MGPRRANASRASRRKSEENRLKFSTVLPDWLHRKIGPLLSKAETKEKFFVRISEIYPKTSKKYRLIQRAYDAMEETFSDTRRDNGDMYFEHLRASALIAIVHMRVRNANIICAILLHDCVEDKPGEWTFDRIARDFNKKIAELVWWVTKPVKDNGATDAEIDRRYHRRLSKAPRAAICVKLPERLHNIITIWGQDERRVRRKLSETQDFIVPLAEKHSILIHEFDDVLGAVEEKLAA